MSVGRVRSILSDASPSSAGRTDWFVHKILRLNRNENIVQIGLKYDTTVNSMPQHYSFQINNFDTQCY